MLLASMNASFMHNSWEMKAPSPTEPKIRKFWKILRPCPPLNIKISKNRFAGLKRVPLGTFFQKISFLAFNDSERPQWTEKIWLKVWNFGGFLGQKGPKNGNFEKSLVRPQGGHISILCMKFQLSSPYRLREIAADGRTDGHKTAIVKLHSGN